MIRSLRDIVVFLILSAVLLACSTVPITGRRQLSLIPGDTMLSMSFQQYDDFLKTHKLSSNSAQTEMVKRVGVRIQKAVEQYFRTHDMAHELDNYAWEFNLVDSKEINAWAMPGGKVVVYTGILPLTRDDTGLAVVLGHEISHAIAGHGGERMSQGLAFQMGGMALAVALANQPQQTQQLWMTAFGAGAQFGVLLPYSRLQESEADELGLIFMAMAGYDPREAVGFWERMSQKKGGAAPPEFMSTHPSDATRIQNIQHLIPEALKYYRKP